MYIYCCLQGHNLTSCHPGKNWIIIRAVKSSSFWIDSRQTFWIVFPKFSNVFVAFFEDFKCFRLWKRRHVIRLPRRRAFCKWLKVFGVQKDEFWQTFRDFFTFRHFFRLFWSGIFETIFLDLFIGLKFRTRQRFCFNQNLSFQLFWTRKS